MLIRKRLSTIALLSLAACSDSGSMPTDSAAPNGDGHVDASTGAGSMDAGTLLDAAGDSGHGDASVASCELPSDCLPARSSLLSMDPCCSASFSCGFSYVSSSTITRDQFYATFQPEPGTSCVPESKLFFTGKTGESQRVQAEDGGQILVSSACQTAFITSLPFRGCCLPSNECAVTTYAVHNELKVVIDGADLPFTHIECVKTEELRAQFRNSALASYGRLPLTTGSCDYAALDNALPKLAP